MYAESACMKSAEKVFAIILEVSVVSWNGMVTGYDLIFQNQKVIEYLRRMKFWGFEHYEVTYSNLLAAYVNSNIVLHDDGMMIVRDDIADGDKELTISLLWNMFVHLWLPPLVKKKTLAAEICKIQGNMDSFINVEFMSLELLQNEYNIDQVDVRAVITIVIIQLHSNEAAEIYKELNMMAGSAYNGRLLERGGDGKRERRREGEEEQKKRKKNQRERERERERDRKRREFGFLLKAMNWVVWF
ncbi:hypothetical protein RchiOBHm_Chr6g0271351 [Rosa chinensis]|uniref:Pentatricopeptide n=1 Tax=Rosa chinensis TaxID=74649 RepID=A0A2P6PR02_ROSCH|nr:hypothetical protein RchiOBHm_Chr6g0271351 [Rosa chinensis]